MYKPYPTVIKPQSDRGLLTVQEDDCDWHAGKTYNHGI